MNNKYIGLADNLRNRNIDFKYCCSREDLIENIDLLTSEFKTIGIGNSQTLKNLNVSEYLQDRNKVVYDKTNAIDKSEIRELKILALTSECYITSSNAIAETGEIVNIDHSGNRVAAMTYGPEKVIIIIGSNKIVNNEKEAISRALNIATPKNAQRAKIKSPCSMGKPCSECNQDVRVCNYLSVIRGQNIKNRMIVLLVEEELGF